MSPENGKNGEKKLLWTLVFSIVGGTTGGGALLNSQVQLATLKTEMRSNQEALTELKDYLKERTQLRYTSQDASKDRETYMELIRDLIKTNQRQDDELRSLGAFRARVEERLKVGG